MPFAALCERSLTPCCVKAEGVPARLARAMHVEKGMSTLNDIIDHERREQRLGYVGALGLLLAAAVILMGWFVYL